MKTGRSLLPVPARAVLPRAFQELDLLRIASGVYPAHPHHVVRCCVDAQDGGRNAMELLEVSSTNWSNTLRSIAYRGLINFENGVHG